MLAPLSVACRLVVDARKEVEVLYRHLLLLDAKLVVQFPLRSVLDAGDTLCEIRAGFARDHERVRAAGVCPHVGEGDLFGGALLQEELVLVVEEKDGEGSVEQAFVDVAHEVACAEVVSQSGSERQVRALAERASFR